MKHLKLWAVFIFTFVGASRSWGQAKTGVNTKNPKATLDVNGELRATIPDLGLTPGGLNPSRRLSNVITHETDGVLMWVTPMDLVFSSGVYVKQSAPNQWNNLYLGPEVARLDFVGQNTTDALSFTFSVLYVKGSGFKEIPASTRAQGSVTISNLVPLSATQFSILFGGVNYTFTLTQTGNTGAISVSNTSGKNIKGTFFSVAQF